MFPLAGTIKYEGTRILHGVDQLVDLGLVGDIGIPAGLRRKSRRAALVQLEDALWVKSTL